MFEQESQSDKNEKQFNNISIPVQRGSRRLRSIYTLSEKMFFKSLTPSAIVLGLVLGWQAKGLLYRNDYEGFFTTLAVGGIAFVLARHAYKYRGIIHELESSITTDELFHNQNTDASKKLTDSPEKPFANYVLFSPGPTYPN